MFDKNKTIITCDGLIVDEFDHIPYHVPRIGDTLRFPVKDYNVLRKVVRVIWGMKDNETLEICIE